jgi:hypothetical protein
MDRRLDHRRFHGLALAVLALLRLPPRLQLRALHSRADIYPDVTTE